MPSLKKKRHHSQCISLSFNSSQLFFPICDEEKKKHEKSNWNLRKILCDRFFNFIRSQVNQSTTLSTTHCNWIYFMHVAISNTSFVVMWKTAMHRNRYENNLTKIMLIFILPKLTQLHRAILIHIQADRYASPIYIPFTTIWMNILNGKNNL